MKNILVSLFILLALLALWRAEAAKPLWSGQWQKTVSVAFQEAIPLSGFSRRLWGRAEYVLFREGRTGALRTKDGTLLTLTEYTCPRHATRQAGDHLTRIIAVRDTLAAQNTRLVIALIPAKARVTPGAPPLPACRSGLYEETHRRLTAAGIPAPDLVPALAKQNAFLKTDTHWSPTGARDVAKIIAAALPPLPPLKIKTTWSAPVPHPGDLTRFFPGVNFAPENIAKADTEIVAIGLTDTLPPPAAVLVGTSYSADPAWNFAGFLKDAAGADIETRAGAGRSPFAAMDAYLADQKTAPRAVIWEIPERYLPLPP